MTFSSPCKYGTGMSLDMTAFFEFLKDQKVGLGKFSAVEAQLHSLCFFICHRSFLFPSFSYTAEENTQIPIQTQT